jgi:hypothetical protein
MFMKGPFVVESFVTICSFDYDYTYYSSIAISLRYKFYCTPNASIAFCEVL